MTASIVNFLIPIAIKILGSYFARKDADANARASYLSFLETMQRGQATPAKLKHSYDDQIKRLKEGDQNV